MVDDKYITIKLYSQYGDGDMWHIHLLVKILNTTHKVDGIKVHDWMFL
jgi:hypothetical protein